MKPKAMGSTASGSGAGGSGTGGTGAGRWVIAALCFSLVLAFAKPALIYVLDARKIPQLTLAADFGIPQVKWIKMPVPPALNFIPSAEVVGGYMKWPSIGLDFKCIDVHVRCAGPGRGIYSGECAAGDPLGRKFLYPPLMAHLFVWVRWFTPAVALGLWSLFVLAGSWVAVWLLARVFGSDAGGSEVPAWQTALLFTLFYPVLFAFERGNNDVWVLLLYAAAVIGWMRDKSWLAGVCVAAAVMLKIYPAALWGGCFVAALAALRCDRKRALSWLAGLCGGLAAVFLPLAGDYRIFFTHFNSTIGSRPVIRGAASLDLSRVDPHSIITGSAFDHSLKMAYGVPGLWFGILLWGIVLAVWCGLALKKNDSECRLRHARLAFLFLAALCTYLVPGTESFDYNLVTAVPLFVAFIYFRPITAPVLLRAGAALWVLGAALPRWVNEFIFGFPERSFSALLVLQAAGMCLVAAYLAAACIRLNRPAAGGPC